MIISASRRTDIPAFYSDWIIERIRSGFALVRNPFNSRQVSKVTLNPEAVDCLVFWTKDPKNMLDKLSYLKDYCYYFQFTITPYDRSVEPGLRDKGNIIETFKKLADRIGSERVIWRYDPIIVSEQFNLAYHFRAFEKMVDLLQGHTEKCVISFLDYYKKISSGLKRLGLRRPERDEIRDVVRFFAGKAKDAGIHIETCSEEEDLDEFGITHGSCIDGNLINRLTGRNKQYSKDRYQRSACRCVESVDIGSYNTCLHRCSYCYANFSQKMIYRNYGRYDSKSPILCSRLDAGDTITERKE